MNILNAFGFSLSGVMGALVNAAFSTASVLFSMATAQASNPWTAITASLTFISAAMTIEAAVQGEQARQRAAWEVEQAKRPITYSVRL